MSRTKADIMHDVQYDKAKKIANNTFEYWQGKDRIIRLHDTDIIRFNRRGTVTLNSGGWQTVTTKDRINGFQHNCSLLQRKGVWYISVTMREKTHKYHDGTVYKYQVHNEDSLFFDGIRVTKAGKILNPKTPKTSRAFKKNKKITKLVNAYVKKINDLKTLPDPETRAGDCFYCQMYEVKTGKPLGEAIKDRDHLLLHLKEGHVMFSLIWNALQGRCGNPYFVYEICKDKRHWGNRSIIVSAVRRYLKRQLGLVA
jgi:hypothetical protein